MIAITRTLEFGGLKVTVKELTVAEIRAWMNEVTDADTDFDFVASLMAFDGIGAYELLRFTDLQREQIDDLTPSIIQKIAAAVKDVNSVFFVQYLRLKERVEAAPAASVAGSSAA